MYNQHKHTIVKAIRMKITMKLEGLKNLKDFQKIAITVWSITAFFSGDGGKNFTKQQKHRMVGHRNLIGQKQ